ncbi:MAG TPA: 4Fe-4S cluster-binding domain-containing protein, partial [Gammaproteobacteria bacterium]|nr:4Fe-4S cluster-binding domain-containing protein [Gammaproteobacteria bacterium]
MTKQAWQAALADLITDPKELFVLLALSTDLLPAAYAAAEAFPLRVPRGFAARMTKGDPNDPLLRQVLPLDAELTTTVGYQRDPLQETKVNPLPGLLHKYHGRVLVTLTSVCAIHCRYCFRRYFPYQENNPGRLGWDKIMDYLHADDSISEVILSGGDPLAVNDGLLRQFSDLLSTIPHIKRLRLHTRLPVV